jgi:hypothetical protein
MRWCNTVLGALGLALCYGTPAWAQAAAKPEAEPGSGLLTLLVLALPSIFIFVILFFFMIPAMRRARRNTTQVDRSIAISEQRLLLAKEQVALQSKTNRLLRQLVEALGRD